MNENSKHYKRTFLNTYRYIQLERKYNIDALVMCILCKMLYLLTTITTV